MSLIKIAFAKHRLRPNRRLGQNFLIDDALLERLARIACENSALPVLEIGAGIGNFSLHLARHCAKLLVVEKDRSFEPALREALAAFPETEIIIDDFLNLDLERRACGEKFNVVGNLPFYATSAIITRLIDYRAYVDRINITVQKEVAQRLVAKPGTKDYGRLTCLVQFYTQPQIREIIPNQAFFPVPEVDAAFITLQVLPQPSVSVKSEKVFFQVVKAIFSHRRKTLLNSLLSAGWDLSRGEIQKIIESCGLSPMVRGETLHLAPVAKIADALLRYLPR